MTVGDLMSANVLTLQDDASVGRAHAEMKLGRIRHFPVVNKAGSVVGVLSSLDVARALKADGSGRSLPVKSVMTRQVLSIGAEVAAWEAARVLRTKKIGSLPVLDERGGLVGIITASDFLEVAEQALAGNPLRRIT